MVVLATGSSATAKPQLDRRIGLCERGVMDSQIPDGIKSGKQSSGLYAQKGGWKKWVVVYVIAAIVVYGAIYYFFMRNTGSTGGGLGY